MIVEAKDLRPGDRFAGRVVVNVGLGPWREDEWAIRVEHAPIGSDESELHASTFPKGMLLDVERPQKRWRRVVTHETTHESVAALWRTSDGTTHDSNGWTTTYGPVEEVES